MVLRQSSFSKNCNVLFKFVIKIKSHYLLNKYLTKPKTIRPNKPDISKKMAKNLTKMLATEPNEYTTLIPRLSISQDSKRKTGLLTRIHVHLFAGPGFP